MLIPCHLRHRYRHCPLHRRSSSSPPLSLIIIHHHHHHDDHDDHDHHHDHHHHSHIRCYRRSHNKEQLKHVDRKYSLLGPIWDQQGQGGPYVGPMNFTFWVFIAYAQPTTPSTDSLESSFATTAIMYRISGIWTDRCLFTPNLGAELFLFIIHI